jgi:hypothetical protein
LKELPKGATANETEKPPTENKEQPYAVLFPPQLGQTVTSWSINVPQYLQGIMTTSRTISISLMTG